MTGIGGVSRVGSAPSARTARSAPQPGGRFAPLALPASTAAEAAPVAAPAPAMLAAMLALQEADDAPARDRAARKRAKDILAALASLQRALLGGGQGPGPVAQLTALVAELPHAADPMLAGIVSAAVLRARVELARHDRAGEGSVSGHRSFR